MSRMQTPGSGDAYSSNAIVGQYDLNSPKRLMILADISYTPFMKTNMHYWWLSVEEQTEWALADDSVRNNSRGVRSVRDGVDLPSGQDDLGVLLLEQE